MITFFTSPIGLGHATRDIAIAEELKTDILFVSGEGASSLTARKGFKALDVYRPPKFIIESGQLQNLFTWLMRYYLYYKKCKVIAKEILDNQHDRLIVRQASADRNTLRKQFGFEKNTILVSGGGTDAGKYLIQRAISVHQKLQSTLDSELIIVSGPSLNLPNSQEYRNLGFVDNMHDVVYAADLVISLAGRSTMDESMAYGTPEFLYRSRTTLSR